MISNEELMGKVDTAKRRPNYSKLVEIALKSSSPTNAANTAREEGLSLGEQQDARWIRMFLEITNLRQKTSDGGAEVVANNETKSPLNVAYLQKDDTFWIIGVVLGILSIMAGVITLAWVSIHGIPGIDRDGSLGVSSFTVLGLLLTLLFIWIGVRRWVQGDPCASTLLPENVFWVECAYRIGVDIYVAVSGRNYSGPRFVHLQASSKFEIIGFPERTIGPGEFYLEVEKHHILTSGVKREAWYRSKKTWRTYTFIPRKVDTPEQAPETV